jgi:hypothetical protein
MLSRNHSTVAVLAAVLTAALGAVPDALGAPGDRPTSEATAEAEAFAARAKEMFKAKEFQRSAKLFMQAYALTHEPALVYNAARAYEEAGMAGDAAGLFRLYISLTDDADGILEARERIKRLEGKGAAADKPATVVESAAPRAKAAPPRQGPSPTVPGPGASVATTAPPPPASPQPAWQKWSATGGATVALTAGVALMLVGKAGTADANERLASDSTAYNSAFDTAETQWWTGAGLTGLGVGLAGVATWLWLQDEPGKLVVAPSSAGFQLAYRF